MSDVNYSPAYLHGIESFNRGAFFAAHDEWEQCWIAEGRPAHGFFKGLIQAAMAMHHLRKGNLAGARKLLALCQEYLAPFRPCRLGLNIEELLEQLTTCIEPSIERQSNYHPGNRTFFDAQDRPQIRLDPTGCVLSE